MTIFTDWAVAIGGFIGNQTTDGRGIPTDSIDFTSRMRGFTADFTIGLGDLGTGKVVVELDNTDGALTPGGGGTYGSFNWFGEPLFLLPKAGLTDPPNGISQEPLNPAVPTFAGAISDFRYFDDGFDSTVTLTALDWASLRGRESFQADYSTSTTTDVAIAAAAGYSNLPTYGASLANSNVFADLPAADWTDITVDEAQGSFVGDAVETMILSDGGFLYTPWFWAFEEATGGRIYYYYDGVPRNLLSTSDVTYPRTFKDVGNIGTTELPFNRLSLGFTTDELVTQAEVGRSGGTTQFSFNDTASQEFGPRSIQLIELMMDTDAQALDMAQYYTNRFNSAEFTVSSFEITSGMIQQYADDAALNLVKELMSRSDNYSGPLYKPTTVSWTYRDDSTATKVVVPMRQQISATPDRWTMTFDCLPAAANMGFILDDTQLGVLDQNRIT